MEVASRVPARANVKGQQQHPPQQYFVADKQTPADESGTETESRARRKFQKASNTTSNDSDAVSFRKPSLPPATRASTATTASPDTKQHSSFMANRRRSTLKENRAPLGPRPFESPNKRVASENPTTSRSFLPSSTSEPNVNKPVQNHHSSYSFGTPMNKQDRHAPAASLGSFDFLPPVSFDDFHTSIASYESVATPSPRLSDFPAPGTGAGTGAGVGTAARTGRGGMFQEKPVGQSSMAKTKNADDSSGSDVPPVPSIKDNKTDQQYARRYSNAARAAKMSAEPASTNVPPVPRTQDATLSLRTRRQSQAPQPNMSASAATAAVRQPRKSIGPGVLGNILGRDKKNQQEQQATASPPLQPNLSRTPSLSTAGRRNMTTSTQQSEPLKSSAMMHTRASKAKSIQPLPRPNTLPDLSRPELQPSATIKAVIKPKSARSDTPPSTDRRKSGTGRISGLGRTISPTDTARLKRISMKQPAPPSPSRDFPKEARPPSARSPSLIPRRPSVTPSPARQTPESTHRTHLPSLNLSRSSSYQSLRAPSASGSTRIGQSASASKLPTPKPRNVYSSNDGHDGQEIVPPVPAIPKAYESPKDLLDTTVPFFAGLKTPLSGSLSGSLDSSEGALPRPVAKGRSENPATPSSDMKSSHRRGLTVTSALTTENPSALTPVNKKSLQPLRLPPLSLQPLSTPTAVRINSFPPPAQTEDQAQLTPPKRFFAKTPSTPMTASKATFYRRHNDEEPPLPPNLRSSSSHYAFRGGGGGGYEEPNEGGVPLPSPAISKRGITPFTSGSLPRAGANFGSRPRLPDEYTLGNHNSESAATKPMGPRARAASKSMTKDTASVHTVSSSEGQEQPSSGNSLRRKLSLKTGWRRTSSKVPATPSSDITQDNSPKYEDMPPPKLPASATFADLGSAAKQPDVARCSLETTRRKPSVASTLSNAPVIEPSPVTKPSAGGIPAVRQMHSTHAQRSSSWSILGSSQRNAATKTAPPVMPLKSQNKPVSHLDKDDTIANEEMRRLSAKRRDTEVAAREIDELRKHATRKDRMTPAQAIQTSAGLLNIFEKGEVIDYKEGVYFCGRKDAKKHVGDISTGGNNNFGYDDERGDYNICVGDHLAYRYEVIDVLGKGSFGQVVRCIDHKHGGLCAVKIIRNKKRFHQQALVEVNILNKLRDWDPDGEHATLTITSSFYFRSHLCITSPCLSINLYELIRAHGFSGFSLNIIRRFSRQILTCLCLLQTKRIIHCDLKPENILLCDPRRADVRVIDFGSSCKAEEKVYTYIQSRFYRSPEVILGSEYGLGIDMWSVGCILAELYTGYPIFPGENEQEQLACIMEIFGPPSRDIIEKCTRRKLFFDSSMKPRVTVSSKGRRRRPSSKTLSGALKCDDEAFLDFLVQCLRWDPDKRLRPDQALSHPFITNEPMRRERPRVKVTTTTNGSASPVKRAPTTNSTAANTSIPSSATATANHTPVRSRPLPETPGTAMKMNATVSSNTPVLNNGPTRLIAPSAGRRQSLVPNSQSNREEGTTRLPSAPVSHAVAGSKRASNGALLAERHQQHLQQQQSQQAQQVQQVQPAQTTGYNSSGVNSTGLPRAAGGKVDLAGAAARESMGAVTSRWR